MEILHDLFLGVAVLSRKTRNVQIHFKGKEIQLFGLCPKHDPAYLSIHPSIYLSIYLSIYPSMYISILLCIHFSFLHVSIYLYILLYLSLLLNISLSLLYLCKFLHFSPAEKLSMKSTIVELHFGN